MFSSSSMFLLLFIKPFSLSRIETIKIDKLKNTVKICSAIEIETANLDKKDSAIIRNVDLKKTVYLKTAIIEKECMTKLKRDILEGP